MAIQYPVPVDSRWATYQVSTGKVVARNRPWPVAGGGPIEGLDPDFVMLRHEQGVPPIVDPRLFYLDGQESIDVDANVITVAYTPVERDVEEKVQSVLNVESEKAATMMDLQREAIQTRKVVSALIEQLINAQVLGNKHRTMLQRYAKRGRRLALNSDRVDELIAQIQAGLTPDLDAGWNEGPGEDEA